MADIVLAPLLQVIFEKLASPLVQVIADTWDLKDHFRKLQAVLPMVQAILEDAEDRQTNDKSVNIWLSRLKDAVYEAEDLLEDFFACRGHLDAWNAKNILKDLQKAAIEGLNLKLTARTSLHRGSSSSRKRETSSFLIKSEICGREKEKNDIVELLLSSSSSQAIVEESVSIISIVGIPGIGKTTLAQLAYNDDRVKRHFDLSIWVFVSSEFSVKNIIKAAIESASGSKCDLSELDVLQSELWNSLHKRKYLLVLDDVWNEDQDEWDKLRSLFGSGVEGSKIVMTTRSQKVALMVASSRLLIFELKNLHLEDCWNLFVRRAFLQTEEDKYPNLLPIGKEITRKCRGIPLAAKILGGLMRFKREEKEWLFVQNSDIWNLGVYQKDFLPVVLLSYQNLPPTLRHCFAFCSVFPKNYALKKEKLIHMWMAQGLILSDDEGKPLEDIGNEYFDELLWLSVFEYADELGDGCGPIFRMHESFYNLARAISKHESKVLDTDSSNKNIERVQLTFTLLRDFRRKDLSKVRHASSVSDCISSNIHEILKQAKHLRTLLLFSGGELSEIPSRSFHNFLYLRVLDLSCRSQELPESIGELRSLRYLDLSNSHFEKLPPSTASLSSLVMLNLFGCYNLKELPSVGQMTELRHLNIRGCEALTGMPKGIGRLIYLQTFPMFIVSDFLGKIQEFSRRNQMPTISCLKDLNLRGDLKIKHLENVTDIEEAREANLVGKEYLESLGLCWGYNATDRIMNPTRESSTARLQDRKHLMPDPSRNTKTGATWYNKELAGEILACLRPNQNLKKLYVVGYPGITFPYWKLPKLVSVVLINCEECLYLPTLGDLPFLKTLHIEGMTRASHIGTDFYGNDVATVFFPSLEELTFVNFPLLQEWQSVVGKTIFPKLTKLILRKCPNLTSVPSFPSLKHLELQYCSPSILNCLEDLTLLSTFTIKGLDQLRTLPRNLLEKNRLLESLNIISCPKLQSLPTEIGRLSLLKSLKIQWCIELSLFQDDLQDLSSLESLEISDCHNLIYIPEIGGLRSLRMLSIENCSKLASITIGLPRLTALEHLTIMYCPSLPCLPEGLEHLSSLRSLTILSCPQIGFLPEGLEMVTTLQSLEIRSCTRFVTLPEWIGRFVSLKSLAISDCPLLTSLPVSLGRLNTLQHLSIQDCPELQRRCSQDGGADWWKIVHVPHRYIFSSQSQLPTGASSSSA